MDELSKLWTITRFSFLEILRSKIIYNTLFLGIGVLIVSYLATSFTFGVPERVALDFGLGTLTISAVVIAIFMGVTLISREIESRTVYMVLVRPLNRWTFLIGRILGLAGILALNIAILSLFALSVFLYFGGSLQPLIFWTILFSFFEALIILSVVVFFSLVTNPILSVIYSLAIYVAGHAVDGISKSVLVTTNAYFNAVVKWYYILFPNFERLNFKDYVLYQQSLPLSEMFQSLGYGISYFTFIMLISAIIFQRKNLD